MEAARERDDERDPQTPLDDLWHAVADVAAAIDHARHPVARHPAWITPARLAVDLGHDDHGARIRTFLRDPDDGGPPFEHSHLQHWNLSAAEATRVRRRFRTAAGRHGLSAREHEVVERYVSGCSVPDVARALELGPESVRTYLRRARTKLRALGHRASSRDDLRRALAAESGP